MPKIEATTLLFNRYKIRRTTPKEGTEIKGVVVYHYKDFKDKIPVVGKINEGQLSYVSHPTSIRFHIAPSEPKVIGEGNVLVLKTGKFTSTRFEGK